MTISLRKIALFLLPAALAMGQGAQLPKYTVSTLPAATPGTTTQVQVIDGTTTTDCTVGGATGTNKHNVDCIPFYNGSAWVWKAANQATAAAAITALTGDVTATGPGSVAATLATVNSGPGACGDSTHVCQITTNGKGLTTAQSAVAISAVGGACPSGWQCITSTGTDWGTQCTSALTALGSGGGVIYTAPGSYTMANNCAVNQNNISLLGAGSEATIINVTVAGDGLTYQMTGTTIPSPVVTAASMSGMRFIGNAATGQIPIHFKDARGLTFKDLFIDGAGATQPCVEFENVIAWTEENKGDLTFGAACPKAVEMLQDSEANVSFGYNDLNLFVQVGNGQYGLYIPGTGTIATMFNGSLTFYGDLGGTGTLIYNHGMHIGGDGGAVIMPTAINVQTERVGGTIWDVLSSVWTILTSSRGINTQSASQGTAYSVANNFYPTFPVPSLNKSYYYGAVANAPSLQTFCPTLNNSGTCYIEGGVAAANNNEYQMGLNYTSTGSNSNYWYVKLKGGTQVSVDHLGNFYSTATALTPLSADPTPFSGLLWWNSSSGHLNFYNGSTTTNLLAPSSGISGQTAGYAIEAATATTATGPFPMDDSITTAATVTVHKALAVNDGSGVGGGVNGTEGTAPTGASTIDNLWADSTSHRWKMNPNNAGAFFLVGTAAARTGGNCVSWAANGIDLVDAGGACGISGGGVTSFSGDGALLSNSGSTGAVSATLANAAAHKFFGNNTGSSAAPGYQTIGTQDASPAEYIAGGGTANAQTATLSPAATSLATGLRVEWTPTAANTTAATLAVNGLTAKSITKCGTTALAANDLTTTAVAIAVYDGTQFQLINPQSAACGAAGGTGAWTNITGSSQVTATGCTQSASTGGYCSTSGSSTTAVIFSVIPGTYQSLQVKAYGQMVGATAVNIRLTFNGDTGANYAINGVYQQGSAAVGSNNSIAANFCVVGAMSSNLGSSFSIEIPGYADTSFQKTSMATSIANNSISTITNNIYQSVGCEWSNTAAITSVTLTVASNDYAANTKFILYGIN